MWTRRTQGRMTEKHISLLIRMKIPVHTQRTSHTIPQVQGVS